MWNVVKIGILRHFVEILRTERQFIASVVRDGEDSCDVIVTVTNVTDDVVEDDLLVVIEGGLTGQLNTECHIWK